MESLSFDIGTQILKISTVEKIKTRNWEEAYDQVLSLVDSYLDIFSIDNPSSELRKFNDQPAQVPLDLSEQFINLIRLNWDYMQRSRNSFNPFKGVEAAIAIQDIVDIRDLTVFKRQDFQLRPALLPYMIFEETDRLMQGLGFTNYIISLPHTHLARGKRMWKIEFTHPATSEDFHMDIVNTTITIDTSQQRNDFDNDNGSLFSNPFSNKPPVSDITGVVVTGDSAIQNFISAQMLLTGGYESEIKNTARDLVKQLWLLKTSGEIVEVFENPLL